MRTARTGLILCMVLILLLSACGSRDEAVITRTMETPLPERSVPVLSEESPEPLPTPKPTAEPFPDPTPEPAIEPTEEPTLESTPEPTAVSTPEPEIRDYILNTNTKKFHNPGCASVKQMKDENRKAYTGTREELLEQGYSPCGNCKP